MLARMKHLLNALSAAFPSLATAQSANFDPDSLVRAEILPGWRTEDGTQMAALRLTLAEGWKTYWRAPGDAGIPPRFDLAGSGNIAGLALHWPTPEVFHLSGMQTIGYTHELILPMEFTPGDPGAPMTLNATVDLGVCEQICVPVTLTLRADLHGTTVTPVIQSALASQPHPRSAPTRCTVVPIAGGLRVTAALDLARLGTTETGVIEVADPTVWVSEAVTTRSGDTLTLTGDLLPSSPGPFVLDRSGIRLTILSGAKSVELTGCPSG